MWFDGTWVSHLWFLIYLLIYSAIGALTHRLGKLIRVTNKRPFHKTLAVLHYRQSFLLLGPFFCMLPLILGKLWPALIYQSHFLHTVSFYGLLYYLPYFLVGMWLYNDGELQEEWTVVPYWQVGAMFLALSALLSCDRNGDFWEKIVYAYSKSLVSWLSCVLCLSLAKRFFDCKSDLLSYLSEASLSVYLSHHLLVIWLGFLLLPLPLPGAVKFLAVLLITLTVCLAFHNYVVQKVPLFRFLFTGRLNRDALSCSERHRA